MEYSLEERLNRLERQNRIYRKILVLAILLLTAAVGFGAGKRIPDVVKARKFEGENSKTLVRTQGKNFRLTFPPRPVFFGAGLSLGDLSHSTNFPTRIIRAIIKM